MTHQTTFNENKEKDSEIIRENNYIMDIKTPSDISVQFPSNSFGLTVARLKELMKKYRERGENYHDLKCIGEYEGVESILAKLKTNTKTGIDSTDDREEKYGSNRVFSVPVPPFSSYVCQTLKDQLSWYLIILAFSQFVVVIVLSDDQYWIDSLCIIIVVIVVLCIGLVSNWLREKYFHKLMEIDNEERRYKVIRKGKHLYMHRKDILVGDLVHIRDGDIIPADLLLIESNGIKMDESSFTGKSDKIRKDIYQRCMDALKRNKDVVPSPLLLSGTNCVEGNGNAVVIAVGENSQEWFIRKKEDNGKEYYHTKIEVKLFSIAKNKWYLTIVMVVVTGTLIVLFIRLIIDYVLKRKDYQTLSQVQNLIINYVNNFHEEIENPALQAILFGDFINPDNLVWKNFFDILLLFFCIIKVAFPQGVLMSLKLLLWFSIKKMMVKKNLVREIHACEAIRCLNYICINKTGILTKSEMSVYKVLAMEKEYTLKEAINDHHVEPHNVKGKTDRKIREDSKEYFECEKFFEIMKDTMGLNLDGTIEKLDKKNEDGDTEKMDTKNKIDKAFIDFLYRFKSPISDIRDSYITESSEVKQMPFNSKNKRMTTFIKSDKLPKGYRLFTKGLAEDFKNICKYYIDPNNGNINQMKEQQKKFISDKIEEFNKQMLCSLYVCYKDISQQEYEKWELLNSKGKLIDQYDLVFVNVVGLKDSVKDGIKEEVKKCKIASVNVIMVTGDNILTGAAIAKKCNILSNDVNLENMLLEDIEKDLNCINNPSERKEYLKKILQLQPKVLTGKTFYFLIGGLICDLCKREINVCECPNKRLTIKEKENFKKVIQNLKVIARSSPIHKYALVLGLKEIKNVVAVTGDGVNDAPALSKSDVGFSLLSATDTAKESSDIILLDSNFSSILFAIINSRNIYDNIRKFLQFNLTVIVTACFLVIICGCIGNETPLTPIQILWVCLIIQLIGFAFSKEPPYEELLNRMPSKIDESIVTVKMWKHIFFHTLIQLCILLFLYFYAPHFIKEDNIIRKGENQIILLCYGQLPGNISVDNIIYGIKSKWKTNIKLNGNSTKYICGNYANRQNLAVAFDAYKKANGSTAHMTIVFNVFVMYTIFNQLNARVIDDSFNIFARIFSNWAFPVITLVELVLQVFIIQFGNKAFNVVESGLTGKQWGITIGFSFVAFVVSMIVKLIPIDGAFQKILDKWNKKSNENAKSDDGLRERNISN